MPEPLETLVGVDSDGCVFDTMTPKQTRCFHPAIVAWWGLDRIEPEVRAAASFVNLHSRSRGRNRFVALVETFERLAADPKVSAAGVALPDLAGLKAFVADGKLDQDALRVAVARTGDPGLRRVLDWSLDVNVRIAALGPLPPFPGACDALARMAKRSEVVVVSQTPGEALVREWAEHGLDRCVTAIGGQEQGSKAEQLARAMGGRPPDHVLVVGDAPGDLEAARAVGACFYPIVPGEEAASWARLTAEAYPRFLRGTYRGACEAALVAAFERRLDGPAGEHG